SKRASRTGSRGRSRAHRDAWASRAQGVAGDDHRVAGQGPSDRGDARPVASRAAGNRQLPNIPVAPTVTFSFRAQRDGPALAQARTLASGPHGECPGVMFKLPGRAQQDLTAQTAFLRQAQRVLGVALMTK